MPPKPTRPADAEDDRGTETRTARLRRLTSPLVALSGVGLLVGAAREATDHRRRAGALALAGGGLLATWVRRRGAASVYDPVVPATNPAENDGE